MECALHVKGNYRTQRTIHSFHSCAAMLEFAKLVQSCMYQAKGERLVMNIKLWGVGWEGPACVLLDEKSTLH